MEGLQVRLADGPDAGAGRVEVRRTASGDWGTICESGWSTGSSDMVCRMLGFR